MWYTISHGPRYITWTKELGNIIIIPWCGAVWTKELDHMDQGSSRDHLTHRISHGVSRLIVVHMEYPDRTHDSYMIYLWVTSNDIYGSCLWAMSMSENTWLIYDRTHDSYMIYLWVTSLHFISESHMISMGHVYEPCLWVTSLDSYMIYLWVISLQITSVTSYVWIVHTCESFIRLNRFPWSMWHGSCMSFSWVLVLVWTSVCVGATVRETERDW